MNDFRNKFISLSSTDQISKTDFTDVSTKRQKHAKELIENYVKQLTHYEGAEEKFRTAVEPLVNQYVRGSLPEKMFDAQVAQAFNQILNEVKKDSEDNDRQTYANEQVNSYAAQLKQYQGAETSFRNAVRSLVTLYVNGSISKNQFDTQLQAKFNEILNAAINNSGGRDDKSETKRRTDYAKEQVDDYVEKLAEFEGAGDRFTKAVEDIVSQYINGVIEDDADFDEKLEDKYTEIYNEEVTNARTARSNYAYGEVNNYAEQLSEYEGAGVKFKNAVQDLVDKYIAAKITKNEFDAAIKAKFDEVLQTAQTSSEELGNIELFEYTENTRENREQYLRSVIEQYSKALHGYPFRHAINDLAKKFADNKITKDDLDEQIKEIFAKISSSIVNTEEITEDDGSKIVKNYDAQGRVISETKCDANGNKVYEKSYEYNEKGLVQKRVVTEYDVSGNFTISTYDRKTGAIKREVYYIDSNPYNWIGDYGEFEDLSEEEAYNSLKNGKIKASGASISAWDLSTMISYNLNHRNSQWMVTTKEAIEMAVGGDATFTIALLEAAQIGKGAPTSIGCTKTYETYMDTEYADFIRQELYDALYEAYGYEPEDVRGYFFPSDSRISKAMAAAPETTNFVKNNIQKLLNGELPLSMGFNQSKDLYYSIASCKVIDSKLSGTTLTLTMFDIYDFDLNFLENINENSSRNDVLNAAGAADMKRGTLKPYYEVWEVKIDLTTIFSTDELKALGVL